MPTRQILFMLLPHLLETCEQKTQNPERGEKLIKVLNSFPFYPRGVTVKWCNMKEGRKKTD